jgi:hypothetical protein
MSLSRFVIVRPRLALIVLHLATSLGCGDDTPAQPTEDLRLFTVSPSSGPAGTATAIVIVGAGFQQGATLRLDNVVTPSTVISSGQLRATAPAHAAGAIEVAVTNPSGQTTRLERAYTYFLTATRLRITGDASLFAAGDSTQLTATADYSDGTTGDVTAMAQWQSSPAEIATVTQTGLVTARALGSVFISARYPPAGGPQSVFANTTLYITPPGTFVVTGRVREPGFGSAQGAQLLTLATGQSIVIAADGSFSIAGLTDGRLLITKAGFEDVSITAEPNSFIDVPLQRVTQVVAGGAPINPTLAPNDVEYHVSADTICQPCRMIRVSSQTSGTVRVRITWTDVPSTLNLWSDGQMFPPTATRELVADLSITGGVEKRVYVGKMAGPPGNYVPFTVSAVLVNP